MSKPKTHVAIVLDKSGSMNSIREQTVQGYNEQVQQLKENAKDQDILVSLITFNGEVFENIWDKPVEEINEATMNDYNPNGTTSMRDAVGYVIQKFQNQEETAEDVAYLVIVISDGQTNSDRQFTVESLKEMIDSCQNAGNWTFTYMGCSEEYMLQVAKETGVSVKNMASWNPESADIAYARLAACSNGYFDSRSLGITQCVDYTGEVGVADFSKKDKDIQISKSSD